ncbi:MAG: hypothetical protein AAB492_04135 [Patescibacteria group bacterium]
MQKVLLIGGSGKQSGAVYLPILLDTARNDLQLVAIADPLDPLKSKFASKYSDLLQSAKTRWLPLKNDPTEDLRVLSDFFKQEPFDTLAISCPPLYHAMYVAWGLKHGTDVIVDKPFVCLKNQFGDASAAKKLRKEYTELQQLRDSSHHRTHKRKCMVAVPLMRRAAAPYTTILQNIREVYEMTGQHITHMQALRSDGCFRFADEFDRPGAHGYREGLGTLTMSGYHYLDYIAACVMAAPPEGNVLEAHMVKQTIVGDVRKTSQDVPYARFLKRANVEVDGSFQGDNAELDFSVSFSVKKPKAILPECDLQFSFIQRGCTRRISPSYSLQTTHDEGLTNDCVMVVHQGPLQSFHTLVAQDSTTNGRISVVRRINPTLAEKLGIPPLTITDYELKNNENIQRNQTIINGLLDKFSGKDNSGLFDQLDAKYQSFTMELYAATIGASVKNYRVSFDPKLWNTAR